MVLKNLAMETDFQVERVTIAVDVSLVEGVCGGKPPWAEVINPLHHGIEGVMLDDERCRIGAPPLSIRSFDEL